MKKTILASVATIALMAAAPAFAVSYNNQSTVTQNGTNQSATVDQSNGEDGASTIDQSGSNHTAKVTQGVAPLGGDVGNSSLLTQTGDLNDAEVEQSGASNESDIKQATFSNQAFVDQISDGADGNYALIDQTIGLDNKAQVTQRGNLNSSITIQGGESNIADVQSWGDGNASIVRQNVGLFGGHTENRADVAQFGDDNSSLIEQGKDVIGASGNQAAVKQEGDNNTSLIDQDGTNGKITVNQLTDNNYSTVTQDGVGNIAIVTQ